MKIEQRKKYFIVVFNRPTWPYGNIDLVGPNDPGVQFVLTVECRK